MNHKQELSSFPPGSTFWNFNGVPVLMDQTGCCTAWDQSSVIHEQVFDSGIQISEADFFVLVTAQGRLKNSKYPPETFFAELDGVPVIIDSVGLCTALDGSFCSGTMLQDGARYLGEAEFLALAAIYKARNP